MMDWKECGTTNLQHYLRYYHRACLDGVEKMTRSEFVYSIPTSAII
jgi:hypothetical protein